jgi:uncharacterized protein YcbX
MQIARIRRIYLYPVKSMRGVAVEQAELGLNGFFGDRRYAFVRQHLAATNGFPWMTGREKPRMLLYAPRFDRVPTAETDPQIIVRTPEQAEYPVSDPRLCELIAREYGHPVFLFKSKRGNYDSQHLSLFSLHTVAQLESESESTIDPRQFRANLYVEPLDETPFVEDTWVGRVLQLGEGARAGVTKKDSRCMMINVDPETAVQNPAVLRTVTHRHGECAGIYANVIVPGVIRVGDSISLVYE